MRKSALWWVLTAVIAATFLFFTSDILAIDKQVQGQTYKPGEIIVKFKEGAAETLEKQLPKGVSAEALKVSASLDELSSRYKVKGIAPLIKGFKAERQRIRELLQKDKASLTEREEHLLRRLKRAPRDAKVPKLDRIYRIELEEGQSAEDAVAEYKRNPDVEYAELNYLISIDLTPNDSRYPIQWPLNNTGQMYPESGKYNHPPGTPDCDIDAPEAWNINTGSSEVIVAIADTGVDYEHRDIASNMWTDSNGYHGYDFVNSDNYPMDDHGHGTHCAGIIAARGNNGLDITGVCWNVKIMALKFLDSSGSGSYTDAAEAFYYAVNKGAEVISNSWGSYDYSQMMQEAIDYAHSQGVIIAAAAGNEIQYYFPHYPASMEHVISVAATNSKDEKATFSNYGEWIDISAPGVDVLSLRGAGTSIGTPYDTYTTIASGTSMSCPHIAGVLGLMLSTYPDISTDEITNRLLETADDISGRNPDYRGLLGSGRVNAHKAIRFNFEGKIKLESGYYSCSDEVEIEIYDFDIRGSGLQQVTLTTNGGDSETVTLAEDTNRPWIFGGSISTSGPPVVVEDGFLQVVHGQTITAVYNDLNYGDIGPSTVQTTATVDCEEATIYGVNIHNITSSGAKVQFRTDEPTTGRVRCGTACGGPYNITGEDITLEIIHDVYIPDLNNQTDYYFVIDANDVSGNQATNTNNGQCYTFSTTEIPAGLHVPSEYPTIQAAIDAAVNGDTIWVSDGIYTGAGNRAITFPDKSITVRSENGPDNCIIDCEGISRAFTFESAEVSDIVVEGITIRNGYAGGAVWKDRCGGAILCYDSSPTINNCVFINNHASGYGGAIVLGDLSPLSNSIISNCTFLDNSAHTGGGIHNGKGNQVITNCIFKGNVATYDYGGGICCWQDSVATIENCLMKNNASRNNNRGAGMSFSLAAPTVKNCLFIDNFAMGEFTGFGGGGIFVLHASTKIINCTFYGNTTTGYGGACHFEGNRDIYVTNCIFSKNYPNQIYKEMTTGRVYVSYSDVQGGYSGTGNINADPRFVAGPDGNYYLSQIVAGQAVNSPCVNAGNDTAAHLGMDVFTTRTDRLSDSGVVDMGYHYPSFVSKSDLNRDAFIDFVDYSIFAAEWLLSPDPLDPNDGDITKDGLVNIYDLAELVAGWLECLVEAAIAAEPTNGAAVADANVTLRWIAGAGALKHDVYFGTNADIVDRADHLSEEFMGTVLETTLAIDSLDERTDYFWRIDEIGPRCTTKGNVWNFETEGPRIGLSANQLEFYAVEGVTNPDEQIFSIYNSGLGTLNWETNEDCGWLSAEPDSGDSTGELDNVNLSVDISGLSAGVYPCNLTISDPNSSNSPQVMSVNLIVAEFIISWWKLDEGTGTIAYDSEGSNNGTLVNGPVWTSGQINGALDFDGTDDYVSVPDSDSLDFTIENLSISLWIKPEDLGDGGIVGKYDNWSEYNYAFWYAGGILYFEVGYSGEYAGDPARFEAVVSSTTVNTANQWYHIAGTYDHNHVRLYINGQEVDSESENRNLGKGGDPLCISTVRYDGTTSHPLNETNDYFHGLIDDVRIYNRALSAEEIEQLYEEGL